MEMWFVIVVTVCLAALLKAVVDVIGASSTKAKPNSDHRPLPPGPTTFLPIISGFLWLRKSSPEMEASLRSLRSKLGPIVTLSITSRPAIFIFSRSLAHKALVENGAVFSDRPKPLPTSTIFTVNQSNINSNGYGKKWRILRRNLTSHILHPSRIRAFSSARSWVLQILLRRLRDGESVSPPVKVIDHFRHAMFCLLVFMCFGDRLDEQQIREIGTVLHRMLLSFGRFQILNFHPSITKLVFRRRWRELFQLKKDLNDVIIPLIRARKQSSQVCPDDSVPCYVDSLLELEVPGDDNDNGARKRKMAEEEMVVACSEFLNGGTDTTSTALQWIMANLVKNQSIQAKLYNEIHGVMGSTVEEIKEDDLGKMEYLKAVVLEGLRRHPPGHFVLPHAVTQPVELGGYMVPENAVVNFMVAEMGWDPEVWEDPMEFKPERFLGAEFDLTGSREIKMMPFGVGRRICPGMGLALLHLEYFVANLVWKFEWTEVDGYAVDLSEKQEFTIVMEHPLHARITPRSRG